LVPGTEPERGSLLLLLLRVLPKALLGSRGGDGCNGGSHPGQASERRGGSTGPGHPQPGDAALRLGKAGGELSQEQLLRKGEVERRRGGGSGRDLGRGHHRGGDWLHDSS
jgi:hypothetical protein